MSDLKNSSINQSQIQAPIVQSLMPISSSQQSFELMQRKAKAYATSDIVPPQFRNVSNCIVALEMAQRMDMNPLMLMQNSYVIHGKLGWSSAFIIARINSCGKFTHLRYRREGEGDSRSCIAYANDKSTGEELESVKVTMAMAKAEGCLSKAGSKWKTMPDLMLQYRAASFFGRAYAAEMLLGMQSVDELSDVHQPGIKTFSEEKNNAELLIEQAEAEAQQDNHQIETERE